MTIESIRGYHTLQPNNQIVVAGHSESPSTGESAIAVVRYNTNGSLDANFNGNGIVTTTIAGYDVGYSVAIQPDNKIVVAAVYGEMVVKHVSPPR